MTTPTPLTPTRRSANGNGHGDFNSLVSAISIKWDLQLDAPEPFDSPSSRKSRSTTVATDLAGACVSKLKFLYYKNAYDVPLKNFNAAAWNETGAWHYKPGADADTLPTGVVGPLSQVQRVKLLRLFKDHLEPEVVRIIENSRRPKVEAIRQPDIQSAFAAPIPAAHPVKEKRNSSGFVESDAMPKKSRKGEEQNLFGKIDDVPVTTRTPDSSSKKHLGSKSSTGLLQNFASTKPQSRRASASITSSTDSSYATAASSSEVVRCHGGFFTSANTSYSSDLSKVSGTKAAHASADTSMAMASQDSFSFDDDLDPEDFPSTASLMMTASASSAEERIKTRLQGVFRKISISCSSPFMKAVFVNSCHSEITTMSRKSSLWHKI